MQTEIKQPITAVRVIKEKEESNVEPIALVQDKAMKPIKRPESLSGTTYQIKSPLMENAMYITINDIVMHEGTPNEHFKPYEVFVNSVNVDSYQWVSALTRIMSSAFRMGCDGQVMVKELKEIFDPKGGYFQGPKFMRSLVAEIGWVIEGHLKKIGVIEDEQMDERQKEYLQTKKEEVAASKGEEALPDNQYPDYATVCPNPDCSEKAVIPTDGCDTCLACGHSKCG